MLFVALWVVLARGGEIFRQKTARFRYGDNERYALTCK